MADLPLYNGFLGSWVLIPDSCQYEQGDAPAAATLRIEDAEGELRFTMTSTPVGGVPIEAAFSGPPDGKPFPFAGGDLADAMSITLVASNDLRTSAFRRGRELMIVQRQLDASGQAMRVTQVVRLPGGSSPANVAVYRRLPEA